MTLKMGYLGVAKANLPIYGIPRIKNLDGFVTSEKDASRGVSRVPMAIARLYDEDFLADKNKKVSENKFSLSP